MIYYAENKKHVVAVLLGLWSQNNNPIVLAYSTEHYPNFRKHVLPLVTQVARAVGKRSKDCFRVEQVLDTGFVDSIEISSTSTQLRHFDVWEADGTSVKRVREAIDKPCLKGERRQ